MNTTADKPLVSVIIPAYNVEQYIFSSIQSVRNQKYGNIEIILIDDGSTDRTGQIMDEAAKDDDRIRVFHHKSCKGVSNGRNEGVELSKGKYIAFVDSDDIVSADYIIAMTEHAEKSDCDIVCCDYIYFQDSNPSFSTVGRGFEEEYSGAEAIRAVYQVKHHGFNWTVWAKLYRADLFRKRNIQYPDGCIHEDMAVTYRLIYSADRVLYLDRALYGYRKRQGSIMNSTFDRKRLILLTFSRQAIDYFKKNNQPDLADLACNYHIRISFTFLYRIKKEKMFTRQEEQKLLMEVRQDIREYVDPGHLPAWKKAVFHITAGCPFRVLLKRVGAEF